MSGLLSKPGIFPSRQIEFARGNITYTALSKRYIREMMEQGIIRDWDDPRTYTLRGLRRLGCPPEAVRRFWREVGVAKRDNNIDIALLEHVCATNSTRRRCAEWPFYVL